MEFDEATKLKMYRAGEYRFTPPPVCHRNWSERNWTDYIDRFGVWTPKAHPGPTAAMKALVEQPAAPYVSP